MYEELSRLMDGELDADAESRLRARIATDPALGAAWRRMQGLSGLLAALPTETPPAHVTARMHAVLADGPRAEPAHRNVTTLPHKNGQAKNGHNGHNGQSISTIQLVERAPPRTDGGREGWAPARRYGILAAGLALAASVGLAVGNWSAPAHPTAVTLRTGTVQLDGPTDVVVGGLRVHVDGQAELTVVGAPLGAELALPEAPGAAGGSTPVDAVQAGGDDSVLSVGGPVTTHALGSVGAAGSSGEPMLIVRVARGAAEVENNGDRIRVAAGEVRRIPTAPPTAAPMLSVSRPVANGPTTAPSPSTAPPAPLPHTAPTADPAHDGDLDGDLVVARASLGRLGSRSTPLPGDATAYGPGVVAQGFVAAAAEVPGVILLDQDCEELPCIGVFLYDGDDPAWESALDEAIGAIFPDDLARMQISRSTAEGDISVLSVSTPELVGAVRTEERAVRTLDLIEQELLHPEPMR